MFSGHWCICSSLITPFSSCFGAFALSDPFTRNVFLSPLSSVAQILLIHPGSYAPISLLRPFLNPSFCLQVSACLLLPSLMPPGICFIVLIRVLNTSCLVWDSYISYTHPWSYLLICILNTWIEFSSESQIRGTVSTQLEVNQCPSNKVNNKAYEQSYIVSQRMFIYII